MYWLALVHGYRGEMPEALDACTAALGLAEAASAQIQSDDSVRPRKGGGLGGGIEPVGRELSVCF
jgi:hypothetical protein